MSSNVRHRLPNTNYLHKDDKSSLEDSIKDSDNYDSKASKNIDNNCHIFLIFSYILTFFIAYQLLALPYDRPVLWNQIRDKFLESNKNQSNSNIYRFEINLTDIGQDEFSPDLAYSHLLRLGTEIHSYNTLAIEKVEEYLLTYVEAIKTLYDKTHGEGNLLVDFDRKTSVVAEEKLEKLSKVNRTVPVYFEASNLLVKVKGMGHSNSSTLLLSAHYDSQGSSHGASDDGISVAIFMEVLRLFIKNPPKVNVIFNFNSGEEKGLMGSKAFIEHPWHSDVSSFINLEASGVGGRALMFQSTSETLSRAFSHAPNPHASVLGNDAYRLKALNSRTDFEVYNKAGIPGIDMALYSNRAFYHTRLDDINHIYYTPLKKFGESICAVVENLTQLPQDKLIKGSVFFDILGLFMIVTSFEKMQILVGVTMISQFFLLFLLVRYLKFVDPLKESFIERFLLIVRCFVSIMVGIVAFLIFSFISNKVWVSGEGVHVHRFALWIYLTYAPVVLLCFIFSLAHWQNYENVTQKAFKYVLHITIGIFCLILQAVNLLSLKFSIGSLYVVLIVAFSNITVALIDLLYPQSSSFSLKNWNFQLLISSLFTCSVHGFSITILTSLSQGIPTGNPKNLAYYLCSGLSLISVLNYITLLPSLITQHSKYLKTLLFTFWFLSSSFIFYQSPISSEAPLVFHFDQHVCVTPIIGCRHINPDSLYRLEPAFNTSFSRIIGPAYLLEALKSFDEPMHYSTYSKKFQQAHYIGKEPNFPVPLSEIISVKLNSKHVSLGYEVSIELHGVSSHMCAIRIDSNSFSDLGVSTDPRLSTTKPLPEGYANFMRRNTSTPFHIHLTTVEEKLDFSVWCGYDDVDLFIPAFTKACGHLPPWALLSTVMPALLTIHADYSFQLS